jgi:hypothetical protein
VVIYTIYPFEQVMQESDPKAPHYFTIEMDGRTFVMELLNGNARIVRLVSANPSDYLNPQWQPGSQVGFTIPGNQPPKL